MSVCILHEYISNIITIVFPGSSLQYLRLLLRTVQPQYTTIDNALVDLSLRRRLKEETIIRWCFFQEEFN